MSMTPEVKAEIAKILEEQAKANPRIDVAFALRQLVHQL
jgi:hypothetical protein